MSSHLDRDHLHIEHETESENGQEVTLVRLSGYLNDHTYEAAQQALVALMEAGHLHLRVDLKDVRLGGCGYGAFLTAFRVAKGQRGASLALFNVNERNRNYLNLCGVARLMPIEPLPPQASSPTIPVGSG